jgi:hypothetical protein
MDLTPKPGDTLAVWFSCGAASAVAAKRTLEKYGNMCTVRVLNNPIAEEDSDNQRFLADVAQWLGHPIEHVTSSAYPSQSCIDVWEKRRFMSGPAGAPCTIELKKKARQAWEKHNPHDWIVLGFTYEEKHRHERFLEAERADLLPVLIEDAITKAECYRILTEAGLQLPRVYHQGYPNANCIGCVKATSPTYWNHVRAQHPDVFEQRARQSRELGAKLVRVKGKRIYLDELDPNAKGRPLKNMDIECGLFCQIT